MAINPNERNKFAEEDAAEILREAMLQFTCLIPEHADFGKCDREEAALIVKYLVDRIKKSEAIKDARLFCDWGK